MNINTINKIVWWVPIKNIRNKLRNHLIKIDDIKSHNDKVKKYIENYKILFIELETQNRCNGTCSFCPVSVGNDIREYKTMSENLFNKIIDDLNSINYNGIFSLYSNNESLLDKRSPIFFKIAKQKLPNAYHIIFTNGSVLTVDLLVNIYENLDAICIDNYDDDNKLTQPVLKIYEFIQENPKYKEKVKIIMRKKTQILTNRAGQAPNKKEKIKTIKKLCVLPFCQFVIRPDGKVSLCCNDSYGKKTLGDLNNQTVMEIWNGEIYKEIRKLSLKGRKYLDMCKYCDYDETSKNHINRVYESLYSDIKDVQSSIVNRIPEYKIKK